MTAILRQLPFLEIEDEVHVGPNRVPVKPYQIILWVSITAQDFIDFPPHTPRFPVILDTAHNHNFSIQARHLTQWASLDEASLPRRGRIREGGRLTSLFAANVWIHPNRPGERDAPGGEPPFLLPME
jgi:hypothetical protein